jgi:hypothetical protein
MLVGSAARVAPPLRTSSATGMFAARRSNHLFVPFSGTGFAINTCSRPGAGCSGNRVTGEELTMGAWLLASGIVIVLCILVLDVGASEYNSQGD